MKFQSSFLQPRKRVHPRPVTSHLENSQFSNFPISQLSNFPPRPNRPSRPSRLRRSSHPSQPSRPNHPSHPVSQFPSFPIFQFPNFPVSQFPSVPDPLFRVQSAVILSLTIIFKICLFANQLPQQAFQAAATARCIGSEEKNISHIT